MKKLLYIALFGTLYNFTYADTINVSVPSQFESNISAVVIDANTNQVVYSHKADTVRLIASNMKLFTTALGLDQLKPDFVWHTKLKTQGISTSATSAGSVYLQGGGDPTLSSDDIRSMLQQLKQKGINTIQGDLVMDNTVFNSLPTWSMLQYTAYETDAVLPNGLLIDGGLTTIKLSVANNEVSYSGNLSGYSVSNTMYVDSNSTNCNYNIQYSDASHSVTLSGPVAATCNGNSQSFELLPNYEFNKLALTQALQNVGITLKGNIVSGKTPDARLVADHSSPTLATVLTEMNKTSYNLDAMTVFMTAGTYINPINPQDSYSSAKFAFLNYLNDHHLGNMQSTVENGAGLSRHEQYTVMDVANLLDISDSLPTAEVFEATLPISGVDGTMKSYFTNFKGQFHAKTGTLNDTKAYSGYFYNSNKHKYIVSAVINNVVMSDPTTKAAYNQYVTDILAQLNDKP